MIILASDHRGYTLKEDIKKFFNEENIITSDVGTYSKDGVDYPDFAKKGIEKVLENPRNVGIFICGTGLGMSMAANRNPKIRAALCLSASYAKYARAKNDANVLVLSGDNCKIKKAIQIIKTFLTTDFEAGRHARRVKKFS